MKGHMPATDWHSSFYRRGRYTLIASPMSPPLQTAILRWSPLAGGTMPCSAPCGRRPPLRRRAPLRVQSGQRSTSSG